MKMKLILSLLLPVCFLSAQDTLKGYFSNSYQTFNSQHKLITVNDLIYVIYNRNYCRFFAEGKAVDFPVSDFKSDQMIGMTTENFVNGQSGKIEKGWYVITLIHNPDDTYDLNINMPYSGNIIYRIDGAKPFSAAAGTIIGAPMVDWKELEAKARLNRKN